MKKTIFLTIILTLTLQLGAQKFDLPPKVEAGKCYQRCFDYDKKFEWKEIDCEQIKKEQNREKTKEELIKIWQNKLKMKNYQEKLKNLGYEVDINGIIDDKTIRAHHKYLRKKKRDKKKKRKN